MDIDSIGWHRRHQRGDGSRAAGSRDIDRAGIGIALATGDESPWRPLPRDRSRTAACLLEP